MRLVEIPAKFEDLYSNEEEAIQTIKDHLAYNECKFILTCPLPVTPKHYVIQAISSDSPEVFKSMHGGNLYFLTKRNDTFLGNVAAYNRKSFTDKSYVVDVLTNVAFELRYSYYKINELFRRFEKFYPILCNQLKDKEIPDIQKFIVLAKLIFTFNENSQLETLIQKINELYNLPKWQVIANATHLSVELLTSQYGPVDSE